MINTLKRTNSFTRFIVIVRKIFANILLITIACLLLTLLIMAGYSVINGQWNNKFLLIPGIILAAIAYGFNQKVVIISLVISYAPVYLNKIIFPLIIPQYPPVPMSDYICMTVQVGSALYMLGIYFMGKSLLKDMNKMLMVFGVDSENAKIITDDFANKSISYDDYKLLLIKEMNAPNNVFDDFTEEKKEYLEKLTQFACNFKK